MIGVSCPGGSKILDKEEDKMSKYEDLSIEDKVLLKMKEVRITVIVIGVLGSVSVNLRNHLRELYVSVGMCAM